MSTSSFFRTTLGAAALAGALAASPAQAQHAFADPGATFDPRVPTPAQILGYDIGARFTPQRAMMRYIERIAAASKRVKVDTVARTFEGREFRGLARRQSIHAGGTPAQAAGHVRVASR